ncbi:ABC transporter substrate-binding protein [Streptomyces melanosporofaciens]|uniref:Peptide/nickel transport system substrate-binding protein n=1 Tax=Streptomyces melanosporofaciens TaxID=67327 RepID=A0A1H4KIG0_STRMJ|nr:ABC transporter substrate-binding protein [Streptomyces melanosporofaciens]SEB58281.1 peptide/nickel transport system substrate-binding protein [Streptomyces melanosporofaciens]
MNTGFSRTTILLAGVLCAVLTATACGGTADSPNGKSGGTLNVVSLTPPSTFNPARAGITVGENWYTPLAYDSLIHRGPNSKYEPGLATSWKYVGKGNREFRLTLRPGVKFADGTPVTTAAVVNSLKYTFADPNSPQAPSLGKVSVEATGDRTVTLKLARANPEMPYQLSSTTHLGSVISARGLANKKALGHRTFGAGPYVLDEKASVSGDHYTYTPNRNYYNKSAIRYDKIVIKVVSSTNAALSLLKTGAADVAQGDVNTMQSAKSANLKVYSALVAETGIQLTGRAKNAGSKPLRSKLVRQALNYAVDRKAIAEGLLHGTGKPVNQIGTPGTPDYLESEAHRYAYDPDKAKSLLAKAGYPNGFSVTMLSFTANPPASDVAQAVISDWAKVGVKVRVVNASDGAMYSREYLSGGHPMVSYGYGYIPFFLYAKNFYVPTPGLLYGGDDPELAALVRQGDAATGAEQRSLYDQATRRAIDLAWLVPVTSFSVFYYTSPKVKGVKIDLNRPLLDLTELSPA